MRSLRHFLALCALVATCFAGATSTGHVGILEGPTPLDVNRPYVDPFTRDVFWFYPSLNLFLGPARMEFAGKNATSVTGALGMFATGAAMDSARGAPVGLMQSDSCITLALVQYARPVYPPASSPNCTTQVFLATPDTTGAITPKLLHAWVESTPCALDTTSCAIFRGPNDRLILYLKPKASGAVNPSYPVVVAITRPFRRP